MAAAAITGLLALMLTTALLGGAAAERLRLPRLVGWLLAGIALRWALVGLERAGLGGAGTLLEAGPEVLTFIKRLALTAVMFSIGIAFELHHLRRLGRGFLRVALAQSAGSAAVTFLVTWAAGRLSGAASPALTAAFLAVIAVAVSPAATLLTLRQYEAKGHATESILAVTGLSAVIAILLFDLAVAAFGQAGWLALRGGAPGAWSAVLGLVAATGGSVLVGAVLGVILAFLHGHIAYHREAKVLLAMLLGILALSAPLRLDYLLTGLVAGVTFINIAHDPGRLEERLSVVGTPMFALLFVVAGLKMRLSGFAQPTVLAVGAAYLLARSVGKVGATWLALRRGGAGGDLRPTVGLGLLCHAGVALGLLGRLKATARAEPWLTDILSPVVLASVAVFEFAGPLLLKRTIVDAGEVKAFRLFHLPRPALGAWGRIWEGGASLLRRLGLMSLPGAAEGPILARHVMHVNVKVLKAGAGLDEVLHFIERSRLDHFPVVDSDGRFIGTIDLADVRDIIYDPALRGLVDAQDLLEGEQVTASPDETLDELFEKFRTRPARDLIVLDGQSGTIMGIVEQRDVLRAMHVQQTGQVPSAGH